jgi:hypothetical protein
MDPSTLIAALEMSHARLLGELDVMEKSGQDMRQVLSWRPGPGRAHLGWQFTHCAATHEKFFKTRFVNEPADDQLLADFAVDSVPSDANVPSAAAIRQLLEAKYSALKNWISEQSPEGMNRMVSAGKNKTRSIGETIIVLAWHEAHHHGQIHLTWNLYKAAHGLS